MGVLLVEKAYSLCPLPAGSSFSEALCLCGNFALIMIDAIPFSLKQLNKPNQPNQLLSTKQKPAEQGSAGLFIGDPEKRL